MGCGCGCEHEEEKQKHIHCDKEMECKDDKYVCSVCGFEEECDCTEKDDAEMDSSEESDE